MLALAPLQAGLRGRSINAATCRLLMVLQTRLTHGATVTVPSPSPGSLHMIADIASTDMSELLSDMQGVNAGMMCSLVGSDTGAGKKRAAMHGMQLDARQLADALAWRAHGVQGKCWHARAYRCNAPVQH